MSLATWDHQKQVWRPPPSGEVRNEKDDTTVIGEPVLSPHDPVAQIAPFLVWRSQWAEICPLKRFGRKQSERREVGTKNVTLDTDVRGSLTKIEGKTSKLLGRERIFLLMAASAGW